tara:strand:- start:4679 stop:4834 length:156 start_codon:yes stop_codon:yes gene_type:complete
MNLHLGPLANPLIHQKVRNVLALISLQLDDLSKLLVFHDGAVATEILDILK